MKNSELNRDVKRLGIKYVKMLASGGDPYFQWLENEAKPEIKRVFGADTSLSVLTAANLRRMIALNNKIQAVPFHVFGMMIDLEKI